MCLVPYNWSPPTSTSLCSTVVQYVENAQKLAHFIGGADPIFQ
jgi:hypothetical protein